MKLFTYCTPLSGRSDLDLQAHFNPQNKYKRLINRKIKPTFKPSSAQKESLHSAISRIFQELSSKVLYIQIQTNKNNDIKCYGLHNHGENV